MGKGTSTISLIERTSKEWEHAKSTNKAAKGENYYCFSDKFISVSIVIPEKSKEER